MKINKNLICGIGLGLAGLISNGAKAQDIFGVDYIRKMEVVNRENSQEIKKSEGYSESFLDYNNFSEALKDEARNNLEGKVMNIYFATNDSELSEKDKIDLKRYVLKVLKPHYENSKERLTDLTITGFADSRGDEVSNYELSKERADNVAKYLQSILKNTIPSSPKVFVSAFGEDKSEESRDTFEMQKDRVVKINPNENPIELSLKLCGGKKILGDQSGSMAMGNNPYWKEFQKYEFPEDAEVYTYSKVVGVKLNHTYDINTEKAFGKTSYHDAMRKLISSDNISENDTITAVIHGENDFPGESSKDIIETAKNKNVVLNMVGVDLSGKCVEDFISAAKETGGNYYFMKKFNPKTF